ncbi:hypothetical protein G5V59_26850 [Nocardioides sp. W3-2-3]|uniref:hypothetical protein n=1 Tax=Nocardioides convexus TaxID=2712224 RepID=UPI002418B548|nr:hypothetical protein [Nocardioides convexus]NHA02012.1 hypothetical protein [Nocardioides convexus]
MTGNARHRAAVERTADAVTQAAHRHPRAGSMSSSSLARHLGDLLDTRQSVGLGFMTPQAKVLAGEQDRQDRAAARGQPAPARRARPGVDEPARLLGPRPEARPGRGHRRERRSRVDLHAAAPPPPPRASSSRRSREDRARAPRPAAHPPTDHRRHLHRDSSTTSRTSSTSTAAGPASRHSCATSSTSRRSPRTSSTVPPRPTTPNPAPGAATRPL